MEIELDRLRAIRVEFVGEELVVTLRDGQRISTPLVWYPKLYGATETSRMNFQITAMGVSWPALDEDLSIAGMIMGSPAVGFEAGFDKPVRLMGGASFPKNATDEAISRIAQTLAMRDQDFGDAPRRFPMPARRAPPPPVFSQADEFFELHSLRSELSSENGDEKLGQSKSDWRFWFTLMFSAFAAIAAGIAAFPIVFAWLAK